MKLLKDIGLSLPPWSLHDSITHAHQLHASTQQVCTCMPLPQTYVHTYMVHTHFIYLLLLFHISIFPIYYLIYSYKYTYLELLLFIFGTHCLGPIYQYHCHYSNSLRHIISDKRPPF